MTPDPSEYNKPLNIHINNIPISTTSNPTILGLTFDPKLKYSTHTDNTITKAKKTLNLLKLLASTHRGKSKKTLITTYTTLLLPIIEYANTIWSPIISSTFFNKLQKIQNAALRTITGCPLDTNTQNLHSETKILPLQNHLKLHASQLTQKASHPTHHTRSPPQIQKKIHIQQQHQLHPKHTLLLHPVHLSHTNKKQPENHTHKNSTRLHIIHSQQNPQQATLTHS